MRNNDARGRENLEVEFLAGSTLLEAAVTATTTAVATTAEAAASTVIAESAAAAAKATAVAASPVAAEATTVTTTPVTTEAATVAASPVVAEAARAAAITTAEAAAGATTKAAATAAASEQRRGWLGRSRHTPTELSETVGALEETLLVAVPLEAAEKTTEGGVELIGVDLLVGLGDILENLADVLGDLSGFGHVDFGGLEVSGGVVEGQIAEAAADLALLEGSDNQPALALLAGTAGAAKTMNVGFAIAGETDLDDVGDVGKVHSSACCVSEMSR